MCDKISAHIKQISHISPKHYKKVMKLVGRKCLVNAIFDGVPAIALWDTGAMPSLLNRDWCKKNLPNCDFRDLKDIVDDGKLELEAVGGTNLPYDAWIEVEVGVSLDGKTVQYVHVPFLITNLPLPEPIIGYNVIEYLCATDNRSHPVAPVDMKKAFPHLSKKRMTSLINLLRQTPADWGPVMSGRSDVIIPKGQVIPIVSRVRTECSQNTVGIFEPNLG